MWTSWKQKFLQMQENLHPCITHRHMHTSSLFKPILFPCAFLCNSKTAYFKSAYMPVHLVQSVRNCPLCMRRSVVTPIPLCKERLSERMLLSFAFSFRFLLFPDFSLFFPNFSLFPDCWQYFCCEGGTLPLFPDCWQIFCCPGALCPLPPTPWLHYRRQCLACSGYAHLMHCTLVIMRMLHYDTSAKHSIMPNASYRLIMELGKFILLIPWIFLIPWFLPL